LIKRLGRSEFTRIIDCQPQRRPRPISLDTLQSVCGDDTLNHVGNDGRPRPTAEGDRNGRDAASEPKGAVHARQARRRSKPGHDEGTQSGRSPE
jgi:hypothetical protein